MTDQPTTWTPERALQCLRDWASDECDWPKWRREYEDGIDHGEIAQDLLRRCGAMVAEALESAAAEIERLRDEVTQLEGMERQRDAETARADAAEKEVERLRAELAAKQPAEAEAAQQGPSDEEIRKQLLAIRFSDEEPQARIDRLCLLLTDIVQRAGVKL